MNISQSDRALLRRHGIQRTVSIPVRRLTKEKCKEHGCDLKKSIVACLKEIEKLGSTGILTDEAGSSAANSAPYLNSASGSRRLSTAIRKSTVNESDQEEEEEEEEINDNICTWNVKLHKNPVGVLPLLVQQKQRNKLVFRIGTQREVLTVTRGIDLTNTNTISRVVIPSSKSNSSERLPPPPRLPQPPQVAANTSTPQHDHDSQKPLGWILSASTPTLPSDVSRFTAEIKNNPITRRQLQAQADAQAIADETAAGRDEVDTSAASLEGACTTPDGRRPNKGNKRKTLLEETLQNNTNKGHKKKKTSADHQTPQNGQSNRQTPSVTHKKGTTATPPNGLTNESEHKRKKKTSKQSRPSNNDDDNNNEDEENLSCPSSQSGRSATAAATQRSSEKGGHRKGSANRHKKGSSSSSKSGARPRPPGRPPASSQYSSSISHNNHHNSHSHPTASSSSGTAAARVPEILMTIEEIKAMENSYYESYSQFPVDIFSQAMAAHECGIPLAIGIKEFIDSTPPPLPLSLPLIASTIPRNQLVNSHDDHQQVATKEIAVMNTANGHNSLMDASMWSLLNTVQELESNEVADCFEDLVPTIPHVDLNLNDLDEIIDNDPPQYRPTLEEFLEETVNEWRLGRPLDSCPTLSDLGNASTTAITTLTTTRTTSLVTSHRPPNVFECFHCKESFNLYRARIVHMRTCPGRSAVTAVTAAAAATTMTQLSNESRTPSLSSLSSSMSSSSSASPSTSYSVLPVQVLQEALSLIS